MSNYKTLSPDPGPGTYEIDMELSHRAEGHAKVFHKGPFVVENATKRAQASAQASVDLQRAHPALLGPQVYTQVMEARWIAAAVKEKPLEAQLASPVGDTAAGLPESTPGRSPSIPEGLFCEDGIWFTSDGLFYEGPLPTV